MLVIKKITNGSKIVVVIIFIAFLMRLSALTYGLPYGLFGDEFVQVFAAFTLLEKHTLRANFPAYYLPPLLSYFVAPLVTGYGLINILIGKFHGIPDFRNFVLLNTEYFLIFLRFIGAVFGATGVAAIYALAKKSFDKKVAAISILLLAVDFLHLRESMTGRFWSPATTFILLGLYFIFRIVESDERKWYFLAAVTIGFGFGVGYVPIILYPCLVAAHFLKKEKVTIRDKIFDRKFLFSNALLFFIILLFIYANTYAFVRQFGFSGAILLNFFGESVKTSFKADIPQTSRLPGNLLEIVHNFKELNPFLFILGLAGFLVLLRSRESLLKKISFVGIPVTFLTGIAFVFPWIDYRYVLPAVPFFIILAAYVTVSLWEKSQTSKYLKTLAVLLLIALFAFPLWLDFFYIKLLTRKDTEVQAQEWIYSAIPEGKRIITNMHLNSNKDSEVFLVDNPSIFGKPSLRDRYLASLDADKYPRPNYFIYDIKNVANKRLVTDKAQRVDYVVYTFNTEEEKKDLSQLPYKRTLIKSFYPQDLSGQAPLYDDVPNLSYRLSHADNLGSFVEIYRVEPLGNL